MSRKKTKGKGIFFIFFILTALGGAFVSFFPLVESRFPEIAQKVNSFRGYYSGPLFNDEKSSGEDYFTNQYHGFKSSMEDDQLFSFVLKDDAAIMVSAYYDNYSGGLIEIDLYTADNMDSPVATNLNVAYEKGRQVGAISQMGEVIPDHANWFTFKGKEDVLYTLRIIPESSRDIGNEYVVRIDAAEGWISLQGLWAFFTVILFFLFLGSVILRVLLKGRRKR